jgi:phosphoglycolate phosphatase
MKLAIFDMDGTIIDTILDIHACLIKTVENYGFPPFEIDRTKKDVGDGMRKLVIRAVGEDNFKDEMETFFRAVYAENMMNTTKVMDGYDEVFSYLEKSDYKAVVLSNKLQELTHSMIKHFAIDKYFSGWFGGDSFGIKKPSPIPVIKIMEKLDISPENTIMLGDNYSDILAGSDAGAKTCFCSFGYGSLNGVKSDYTADKPCDIINVLEDFAK